MKRIIPLIDLLTKQEKRPEARQLLYSLTDYMNSDDFSPANEVDVKRILSLYQ